MNDIIANIEAVKEASQTMLNALLSAECAVQELCHGQHPDNQCWVTLGEIKQAIAKAKGEA